jgi:chromosome segregation ATPase
MSFDINKFKREYKLVVEKNKELKARLEAYEPEKAQAIQYATIAALEPLTLQVARLRVQLNVANAAIAAKEQEIVNLERVRAAEFERRNEEHAKLWNELHETRNKLAELDVRHDLAMLNLAAQQPALEIERRRVEDLTNLLDTVRSRMRRKELEEESAIHNRKALSAAAPGLRRP